MSTNDHYSRTRTQSFPADLSVKKGGKGKIIREESESIDHFDADDEASSVSQFGSKVSSLPGDCSTSSLPRTPSLMGSIYSIGGAVWNYIRGPVDTDSNDDLIFDSNGHPRNRSKSMFSLSRTTSTDKRQDLETFSECGSVSSEAPDFDTPLDSNAVLHYELDSSTANESGSSVQVINAGLNKIVFTLDKNGTCRLLGREFPKEEFVLSFADISSIQSQIPARWKVYSDWILLYSSRGNGFSLTTLFHQVKNFKGPVIVAIKDESSAVFGAFTNQTFQPRQGHYGNGECFLWKRETDSDTFIKYASTGKNNYFIMSDSEYLAIGCGNGKFGLWLDKDLFKGNSDPVPTFDNEQLSTNPQFDCMAIEIWGLDLHE